MNVLRGWAAVAALIALSACGGGSTAHASPSPPATASPSPSVNPNVPVARGYHHMFGTPSGVVLFGGETAPPRLAGRALGDVWVYNASSGWTKRQANGEKDGMMVYDPRSKRMVVFADLEGRFQSIAETWVYFPGTDTWQREALGNRPDSYANGGIAYDSAADRIIVFEGVTWAYNSETNTWKNMQPKSGPDHRDFPAMDYDPVSHRVFLFGGGFDDIGTDQTWTYDYKRNSWTQLHPVVSPPARMHGVMVYEPGSRRFILFGGEATWTHNPFSDTWAYDPKLNTWTNLSPATSPSPRARHAMAYDAQSKTIVMFGGGETPPEFRADTWIYDPAVNTWTQRS